jgi:hypothetical protein
MIRDLKIAIGATISLCASITPSAFQATALY